VKYYGVLLYKLKGDLSKTLDGLNWFLKTGVSDCFNVNNTKLTNPNYINDGFCSDFTNVGHDLASEFLELKKPYTT